MATFLGYQCKNCDFLIHVSGPHEFKFEKGEVKGLPHPGSIEPADGLYLSVYCPQCDRNQRLIIVEYLQPVSNPFEAKFENIKKEYQDNYSEQIKSRRQEEKIFTECFNTSSYACPACNGDVIYFPYQFKDFHCPKCKDGKFKLASEIMS
jgi:hypothetical protein